MSYNMLDHILSLPPSPLRSSLPPQPPNFMFSLSQKKDNQEKISKEDKTHKKLTTESTQENMESFLYWPTTPENEACPGVWLRYSVSRHWRKMISPLLLGINCK